MATVPDFNRDTSPLLFHTNTGTAIKRRLAGRTISAPPRPERRQSFGRDLGHAAAETYLVTRLSFKLLRYLGYYFFRIRLCFVSYKIISGRVFFLGAHALFPELLCGRFAVSSDHMMRGNSFYLFYFSNSTNFAKHFFLHSPIKLFFCRHSPKHS